MFVGILQTFIGFILRGLTKASGQINICSPFSVEGTLDQIPASSDADTCQPATFTVLVFRNIDVV